MASPEVTIGVNLEGLEEVTAGFNQIGEASTQMGNKITHSSSQIEVSNRRLAFSMASVIANSVQLTDIIGRMYSGQLNLGKGALLLAMNFLQLIPAITTVVTAIKAMGIASAITQAISSMGAAIPLIIAAAAAAAGIAIAAYASSVPSYQFGGPIYQTRPYLLHAGEYVLPRGASAVTINVYGAGSPRETSDVIIDALRRQRVI